MYNPFSLEGKTILVTGASSGIGKATAICCSKMGAKMIITGRDNSRLQQTFSELDGKNHLSFVAELTDDKNIQSLIDSIQTPINGIVHCAGIDRLLPISFLTKEKMDSIFDINFFAPAFITQKIVKNKKIAKNSSIVFIASVSGVFCSSPGGAAYSASKGAINGIAKAIALDLSPKGIRVNCINPGVVETNIKSSGEITEEQLEAEKSRYPLKRFGQPNEIANAAIYLLSDASAWVTGTNLLIDGGFTLV